VHYEIMSNRLGSMILNRFDRVANLFVEAFSNKRIKNSSDVSATVAQQLKKANAQFDPIRKKFISIPKSNSTFRSILQSVFQNPRKGKKGKQTKEFNFGPTIKSKVMKSSQRRRK